jgi:hypothetical protein
MSSLASAIYPSWREGEPGQSREVVRSSSAACKTGISQTGESTATLTHPFSHSLSLMIFLDFFLLFSFDPVKWLTNMK